MDAGLVLPPAPGGPRPATAAGSVRAETPLPLRPANAATARSRGSAAAAPAATAPQGRSRRALGGIVAACVVGLALVALLLTQVLGGDSTPKRAATTKANTIVEPTASSAVTPAAPTVTAAVRGQSTIFVLNGTTANGLAAEVRKKLETSGYRSAAAGGSGNAAVKTNAVTKVYYGAGKKRAAQDVAKQLSVASADVLAADPTVTAQVTGQGSSADVVVLLGADKASG